MFFWGCPPGPRRIPSGREWAASTRARVPLIDRGLTPSAGPAVRRSGWTALIYAAYNDDRPIVAALLGARADVNTKNSNGCAFAAGAVLRVVGGGRR